MTFTTAIAPDRLASIVENAQRATPQPSSVLCAIKVIPDGEIASGCVRYDGATVKQDIRDAFQHSYDATQDLKDLLAHVAHLDATIAALKERISQEAI